jgi:hypothetical protein
VGDWPFRIPDPPEGFRDEALAVHTFVTYERGQWWVHMEITFWDTVKRYRIAAYRSERLARIAAEWMRRGAARELPRPPDGL